MRAGIALILIFCLAGCGKKTAVKEYSVPETQVADGGIAASNGSYTLEWDSERSVLLLKNNESGHIWSTVPYNYYLSGGTSVNLNSPLFIEYYTPEDGSIQTAKAYSDCMGEGNYSVEKIDDGIKMTFHFIDAEADISLEFKLREDSLAVSVPFKDIKESGKTKIISISVLPYFCAVPNGNNKNSYLFVPSGSGALMYTDEEIQNASRSFTGEVYGRDASEKILDDTADETALTMPVYGAADGENSLFAIIEEGDGFARINAEAGSFKNNYSAVYSSLVLRGSDETEAERNNYTDEKVFAESYDESAVYTVGFYPLSGDNSGYNGMAARYKKYLSDSGALKNTERSQSAFHVNILGGAMSKKFFMGFPYTTLTKASDFSDAEEIIKELAAETGKTPAVTLTGFGQTGVDAGKIAGGFSFPERLGGKKGYSALEKYCDDNKIDLYVDYETVRFKSSGGGVNKSFDTAKTPGRQAAAFYTLGTGLRVPNESGAKIRLLKRSALDNITDKLIDHSKNYKSGISLAALSCTAYSDYAEARYYRKGTVAKQVSEIFERINKSGHKTAGSRANGYAAAAADTVYDTPTDNGGYLNLDVSVPFYSLVFAESTALYSEAVNLADNSENLILKSVEAGVLPSFTFISEYSDELANSSFPGFYGTLFKDQKEKAAGIISRLSEFSRVAAEQYPVSHEIIADGVSKTVFSSGAEVFVNRTENPVTLGGVTVDAMSFSLAQ